MKRRQGLKQREELNMREKEGEKEVVFKEDITIDSTALPYKT